jgi:hypothetical protein
VQTGIASGVSAIDMVGTPSEWKGVLEMSFWQTWPRFRRRKVEESFKPVKRRCNSVSRPSPRAQSVAEEKKGWSEGGDVHEHEDFGLGNFMWRADREGSG